MGGIEKHSIFEAAKILKEVTGDCCVSYEEGRHEVKHSIPTYQKSVDILGFKHTTNLKEGLTEMWEWAKQHP